MSKTLKSVFALFITVSMLITATMLTFASCPDVSEMEQENSGTSASFGSSSVSTSFDVETDDGHVYTVKIVSTGTVSLGSLDSLSAAVYRDSEFLFNVDFIALYKALVGMDSGNMSSTSFEDTLSEYKTSDASASDFGSVGIDELG